MPQWFEASEASRNYCISWCAQGIATAWVRGKWYGFEWQPIGYFRDGGLEQNKQAARMACREHWEITKGANHVA